MSPIRSIVVAISLFTGIAAAPVTLTGAAPPVAAAVTAEEVMAVIATVEIGPRDILAVGSGPDPGDSIYVTRGNNFEGFLYRINPLTFVIDDSVGAGTYPSGIAVSADDTVYVVNANTTTISVINAATMSSASTVTVPSNPQAIALSRVVDDTVFISNSGASRRITTLDLPTLTGKTETAIPNTASPYGLAVASDDSVYITSYGGNSVYRFDPQTATVSTFATSVNLGPIGVAVSGDDTVYVASEKGNAVHAYAVNDPTITTSIAVAGQPQGIAIGPDGRVFVASRSLDMVSVLDPVTLALDDTILVGDGASSIARTPSGLLVVGNKFDTTVSVISSVSPQMNSLSGRAGSTAIITLGGLPTGVVVDDSTVDTINFNGVAASGWSRILSTNSWSGPVPDGTGSVPVSVALQGGNSADLGTYTYTVDPPPIIPAGPPTNVSGIADDRSASLTWAAPASTGSFPVTNYQLRSTPAGGTCLTTTLACEVTGLSNGVDYTFAVRALTGAGWSPWSMSSKVVTPQRPITPSILITGSRGEVRGKPGVVVTGTSSGLGMGTILTPWIRVDDAASFTEGRARILVDTSGDFTWQRRGRQSITIGFRTLDQQWRSNIITIAR